MIEEPQRKPSKSKENITSPVKSKLVEEKVKIANIKDESAERKKQSIILQTQSMLDNVYRKSLKQFDTNTKHLENQGETEHLTAIKKFKRHISKIGEDLSEFETIFEERISEVKSGFKSRKATLKNSFLQEQDEEIEECYSPSYIENPIGTYKEAKMLALIEEE